MSNCKLCNGNFDFRKMQITEILGEVGITFSPRLNEVSGENMFKYCPLCGRKLTGEQQDEMDKCHYVIILNKVIEYEESLEILDVVHTEFEAESFIENYAKKNQVDIRDLYYLEIESE